MKFNPILIFFLSSLILTIDKFTMFKWWWETEMKKEAFYDTLFAPFFKESLPPSDWLEFWTLKSPGFKPCPLRKNVSLYRLCHHRHCLTHQTKLILRKSFESLTCFPVKPILHPSSLWARSPSRSGNHFS